MTVLPSGVTELASVVAGVLLVAGGSCALRGTAERPGVEAAAEPQEWNEDLWRSAARECLVGGRTWSQGMVDGVLVARCSTVESLGMGPLVARRPAR